MIKKGVILLMCACIVASASADIIKPVSATGTIPGISGASWDWLLVDNPAFTDEPALQRPVGTEVFIVTGDPLLDALDTVHAREGSAYKECWVAETSKGLPEFVFDLGENKTIGSTILWQYGNPGGTEDYRGGNGCAEFEMIFHTEAEGGSFDFATETVDYYGVMDSIYSRFTSGNYAQFRSFGAPVNARYVAMRILSNPFQYDPLMLYGGNLFGLGEVRFATETGTDVPEVISPADGEINVTLNTSSLSWLTPGVYAPITQDLYFREGDPNWLDTANTTVVYDVEDILETPVDNPSTTVAAMPLTLDNSITYYWRVVAYEPNAVPIPHTSDTWSFTTISALAQVTTNPASQTVAPGADVELTVAGLNITQWQWYKDGVALTDTAGEISGATTATLTVINTQLADEGYYYCVVDNENDEEPEDVVATSTSARVMTERMVAHWTLDQADGLTAVVTNPAENWDGVYVDPNDGSAVSGVVYVAGADGSANGAVKFNGYNLIEIPDSNEFFHFHPQGFTLTAWLYGPPTGNYKRPVDLEYLGLWQLANGSISTYMNGTGGWTEVVPAAEGSENKWRFVAMTYDPTTRERVSYSIYDDENDLDAMYSVTNKEGVAGGPIAQNLSIGGSELDNSAPDYNYDGSIDDVRIYNYPLTREELVEKAWEVMKPGVQLCLDMTDPSIAAYDYNKDCQVTMEDFVEFANSWLNNKFWLD